MSLSVLNLAGRDHAQDFAAPDALLPGAGPHPPVNFHAYAACMGGSFERDLRATLRRTRPVLLLLRRDHLPAALRALRTLRAAGLPVAVALKETGWHQMHDLLDRPARLDALRALLREAGDVLSPTIFAPAIFRSLQPAATPPETTLFLPTPYPVDFPEWDFSRPLAERNGIFIGTREFFTPARRHLHALLLLRPLAERLGCPVTVINSDGRPGERLLRSLGYPDSLLHVRSGKLPYPEYLRLMASHRLVFQLDLSGVPGQVAGDALLARLPCLGGHSALDSLTAPLAPDPFLDPAALLTEAEHLLADNSAWAAAVARAQEIATSEISFSAIAPRLRQFFATL